MMKRSTLTALALAAFTAASIGAVAAQAESHERRDAPVTASAITNAVSVSASTDAGTAAQGYVAAPQSHGGPSRF